MISAFFIVLIAYFCALFDFSQPTLTLPKAPTSQESKTTEVKKGNVSKVTKRCAYLLLKKCRRQCQIVNTRLWDSFWDLTYFFIIGLLILIYNQFFIYLYFKIKFKINIHSRLNPALELMAYLRTSLSF